MPDFFNIHPYAALAYFIAVAVYSMSFMHPVLVCINIILSFSACFCLAKRETLSSMKYIFLFGIMIALVNPFFNSDGNTVLFEYFGRNYTLEALVYGFVLGGIFVATVNWFSSMGRVITSDKFMFIFGGKLPNLCMMITMVMGLIPFFQNKLNEINGAQSTIISEKSRQKSALRTFNVAVGYAFEHAINLSVSMKNRGFGTGKTTKFYDYKIKRYDIIFFIIILILNIVVIFSIFTAGTNVRIIPDIILTPLPVAGTICYCILLLLPFIMYLSKELRWQYLKSKI